MGLSLRVSPERLSREPKLLQGQRYSTGTGQVAGALDVSLAQAKMLSHAESGVVQRAGD